MRDRKHYMRHKAYHNCGLIQHEGMVFERDTPNDPYTPYICDCAYSNLLVDPFRSHIKRCSVLHLSRKPATSPSKVRRVSRSPHPPAKRPKKPRKDHTGKLVQRANYQPFKYELSNDSEGAGEFTGEHSAITARLDGEEAGDMADNDSPVRFETPDEGPPGDDGGTFASTTQVGREVGGAPDTIESALLQKSRLALLRRYAAGPNVPTGPKITSSADLYQRYEAYLACLSSKPITGIEAFVPPSIIHNGKVYDAASYAALCVGSFSSNVVVADVDNRKLAARILVKQDDGRLITEHVVYQLDADWKFAHVWSLLDQQP